MLGNLKKKLSNAIQEGIVISESLHHQYRQRTSTATTPTTPLSENALSSDSSHTNLGTTAVVDWCGDVAPPVVNMAAGCELLAKYEDAWHAIHDSNETNANAAAKIAEQIETIAKRTTEQRTVMTDLITSLTTLPQLVAKVQASAVTLQQVVALTAETEAQIQRLQDLCEECDLHEFMLQQHCELSQQKQKKMSELELHRQKIAGLHQDKIKQHEARLRQIQRERQAVFDDAFRYDLEEYKQNGTIPQVHKALSHELALEEVDLEDTNTKDALEEFLNC